MPEKEKDKAFSIKNRDEAKYKSLKITLIYFIIGSLWILFSDYFVSKIFIKIDDVLTFSILKGIFYVLATSALIFGLIYPAIKKALDSKAILEEKNTELIKANELQQSLHMELAKEKTLLSLLINSIPDLINYKDTNGVYLGCNKAFEKFTGKLTEEIVGKTDAELYTKEKAELYRANDIETMNCKKPLRFEEIVTYPDKEQVIFDKLKTPLYDPDNNIIGVIGIGRDITQRKNKEKEILYLSRHDVLTGLYNRTYFVEQSIILNSPEHLPLTYIIGNINGMRFINDAFGHKEGDRFLKDIAEILKKCTRDGDVVARIGGDEFSIILPNTDYHTAKTIADRIRNACKQYQIEKNIVCFSIALGLATKITKEESFNKVMMLANDHMFRRKLLEQNSVQSSILSSIKLTLFEKSNETEEHAERLSELSKKLGVLIGLSEEKLDELSLLSSLHDIGKISIDGNILAKKEKLGEDEWKEIRRHPEVGFRIAKETPEFRHIAEYILYHHERWDGKGYPQGLNGEEIPLLSRILTIVDAYDAMTNDRAYRKAMSKECAAAEIIRNAGTQFDPELARLFVEKVINT